MFSKCQETDCGEYADKHDSSDGDNPAAMRYTEIRMTPLAEEMLADIEKETVDFIPNYDDSLREPAVLPERFPAVVFATVVALAVLVIGKKFFKNRPVSILVVVGGIVIASLMGLDARGVKGSSKDFILMDTSEWTAEDLAKAEAIRQDGQYFVGQHARLDEKEYPDAARPDA